MDVTARAVRNNNPGNIERGPRWQGLMPRAQMNAEQAGEPRFAVFSDPKWGFRAMAVTLITYQDKRKANDGSRIDTMREVIDRWAPAFENNVQAYVKSVDRLHPKRAEDVLDFHCYEDLAPLVKAIAIHECGSWAFNDSDLQAGLTLAGVPPPKPTIAHDPIKISSATAITGTTVMGALSEVKDQVSELAFYLDTAKYVLLAIIVVSVLVTLWSALKQRKAVER